MRDENNIEELFQSAFEDFEMTPPDSVKKGIDQAIDGSRYRRIWWISSLVALISGGAIITFLYFGKTPTAIQQQLSAKSAVHSTEARNTSQNKSTTSGLSKPDKFTNQSLLTDKQGTSSNTNNNLQTLHSTHSFSGKQNNFINQNNSTKQSNPIGKPNKLKKSNGSTQLTAGKTAESTAKTTKSAKRTTTKKTKSSGSIFPSTDFSASTMKGSETIGTTKGNAASTVGNDLANNEVNKKNPQTTDKADSIAKNLSDKQVAVTEQAIEPNDSSANELHIDPTTPLTKPRYWMASFYGGPQFGLNSNGNDPLRSVSEKTGTRFSVELNRTLFQGYGITTGLGYGTNSESYRLTQLTIIDSIYLGQDSIPIYDSQFPDSIIGYNYMAVYTSDTTKTESTQLSQVRTIGIPLFVTRHIMFSEKWGLLVNAGAVFNLYKVTLGTANGIPPPTINDFSVNVVARLQLTYKWSNWMLSAGLNGGWDLKPALMYQGLDRKRYFLTPQIGLHFTF